jgi:deoxyribodipyrimidine photolyase-related protein
MNIFLLYPTQLFSNIDKLLNKKIYLLEDPIYFDSYKFHKLKLAYHRSTMKSYYDKLNSTIIKKKRLDISYINFDEIKKNNFYEKIKNEIKKSNKNKKENKNNIQIEIYELYDNKLMKKCKKYFKQIVIHESLNFLVNKDFLDKNKTLFYKNNHYNHNEFYKMQRRKLDILMNNDDTPKGGKWSFDIENREKIPENIKIPNILDLKLNNSSKNNKYIIEAKEYIENHKLFSKNYGSLDNFIYPINHNDTKKWLDFFCKNKFEKFGIYEDAETMREPFLFHSILSPMMNIGLITDKEVLQFIKKYENKIKISSYEGFIRQIIGWRNYVLCIYIYEGEKIRKMNFMNHNNKINNNIIWEGKTNILPFDNLISKIKKYGYAHHIERLMYLGNFLFLCQIKPNDVYKSFMEWTIDSYDWVMVPNVYCMSQYSDGGLMMKKPYFSSYNYILKMSDYKKEKWCDIWFVLYYNFINTHQNYLKKNYGTAMQVKNWLKKTKKEQEEIIYQANNYLDSIL